MMDPLEFERRKREQLVKMVRNGEYKHIVVICSRGLGKEVDMAEKDNNVQRMHELVAGAHKAMHQVGMIQEVIEEIIADDEPGGFDA